MGKVELPYLCSNAQTALFTMICKKQLFIYFWSVFYF